MSYLSGLITLFWLTFSCFSNGHTVDFTCGWVITSWALGARGSGYHIGVGESPPLWVTTPSPSSRQHVSARLILTRPASGCTATKASRALTHRAAMSLAASSRINLTPTTGRVTTRRVQPPTGVRPRCVRYSRIQNWPLKRHIQAAAGLWGVSPADVRVQTSGRSNRWLHRRTSVVLRACDRTIAKKCRHTNYSMYCYRLRCANVPLAVSQYDFRLECYCHMPIHCC